MNRNLTRGIFAGVLGLAVVVVAGCTTGNFPWPSFSGFLGDYKGMYRSKVDGVFVVTDPDFKVANYKKFMVDPVVVYLMPDAKAYGMPKPKLEALAAEFRQKLTLALQSKFEVVQESGPGVLRVRAALTDLTEENATSGKGATVEIGFMDASQNRRMMAILASLGKKDFGTFSQQLVDQFEQFSRKPEIFVAQ